MRSFTAPAVWRHGGHTTLFVLLSFIAMIGLAVENGSAGGHSYWPITLGSVISVVLLSMLELFVACLQAYVFALLTAAYVRLATAEEH